MTAWITHTSGAGGKATSPWDPCCQPDATLKLQGCHSQIQGRRIYCRYPGQSLAFPISSHHTCHSSWATSSCLCTGKPKCSSSPGMVPQRKGGGSKCTNTMSPCGTSQAETQQLLFPPPITYRLLVHTPPWCIGLAVCSRSHWHIQAP